MDFAFVSDLAYSTPNTTQQQLNLWFPPDVNVTYVPPDKYPEVATARQSSAVFKLFRARFPGLEYDTFVVAVRGTTNTYDLLADMQVWFPAMLLQLVRWLLPFGTAWDGTLPHLVKMMSFLETAPSSEVSYVTDLSRFVAALKLKNPKAHVAITGHSLGGGLAIIVGARQRVPAVAFSGPNAVLSRLKFRISRDDLDAFAVNIIPRGDPVPLIDEQALLTEFIQCRTPRGAMPGTCHFITRTLCELQFICGSGNRPPLKDCQDKFDYPAPLPVQPPPPPA
jgi:lipase ATG15